MVGHDFSLHMGRPVFSSTTRIIWIMLSSSLYCSTTARGISGARVARRPRTLMGKPFAIVHMDWFGSQRHKVALDDEPRIFVSKEIWRASWGLLARRRGMVGQRHVGAQAGRRRDRGGGRASVLWQCGRGQRWRYMTSLLQLRIWTSVVRLATQALAAGSDGLVKILNRRSEARRQGTKV